MCGVPGIGVIIVGTPSRVVDLTGSLIQGVLLLVDNSGSHPIVEQS